MSTSWQLRKRTLGPALLAVQQEWWHLKSLLKEYQKSRSRSGELVYIVRVQSAIREMQKSADHAELVVNMAVEVMLKEAENERTE